MVDSKKSFILAKEAELKHSSNRQKEYCHGLFSDKKDTYSRKCFIFVLKILILILTL